VFSVTLYVIACSPVCDCVYTIQLPALSAKGL
jgi:hypothetical protein